MSLEDLNERLRILRAPEAVTELRAFCCKEEEIQAYARENALSDEEALVARSYVVVESGKCVGYFTLLTDAIRLKLEERPSTVRYLTVPALKIARIGVEISNGKRQIGEWMLLVIVGLARTISADVGLRYVTLDALDRPKLIQWYERMGFVRSEGEQHHRMRDTGEFERPLDVVSMRLDIIDRPPVNGSTAATEVI
ncbi:MAG: hypothetical protein WD771_08810 [Gemmatimonadaceae bacterium]